MKENKETDKQNAIISLFREREFLKVIEQASVFSKLFPGNVVGWNLLALGYKNSGNREKAQNIYEHLLDLNPTDALLLTN